MCQRDRRTRAIARSASGTTPGFLCVSVRTFVHSARCDRTFARTSSFAALQRAVCAFARNTSSVRCAGARADARTPIRAGKSSTTHATCTFAFPARISQNALPARPRTLPRCRKRLRLRRVKRLRGAI